VRRALLALVLLGSSGAAAASLISPIVEADLGGGYFNVKQGKSSSGLVGNVFLVPAYQLTDRFNLMPAYSFEGFMFDRAVEEAVFFESRQVHTGMLGYREKIAGVLEGRIYLEAAYAFNRETRDEKTGHGLYDYRDIGGRGVISLSREMGGRPAPVDFIMRIYKRKYPNYMSLMALNSGQISGEDAEVVRAVNGRESRPKDYLGMETGLAGIEWWSGRTRSRIGYTVALRLFDDQYLRTDQGELSDALRLDHMHRLAMDNACVLGRSLVAGADIEGLYNGSNGSVYMADQVSVRYLPRFYQFMSGGLNPWIQLNMPAGTRYWGIRLGVGALYRRYTDRPAQDAAGVNLDNKQADLEYMAVLRGWYPLNSWLSATLGCSFKAASSNDKNEQFVRYNYDMVTATGGINVSFDAFRRHEASRAAGSVASKSADAAEVQSRAGLKAGKPAVPRAVRAAVPVEAEKPYDPVATAIELQDLYRKGKIDAALEQAQVLILEDPDNWRAWQLIGACQVKKNNITGAIKAFDLALKINPDNASLRSYVETLRTAKP